MELEFLYIFLGWLAVVLIAYSVYINLTVAILEPTIPPIPDEPGHDMGKDPRFIMFYAQWCPWSKKAKMHWDSFKQDLARYPVTFGEKEVTLEDIDGDVHRDMVREFKIREYPTFKLVTKERSVTLEGFPSKAKFRDFLIKHLGPEKPAKLVSRVN